MGMSGGAQGRNGAEEGAKHAMAELPAEGEATWGVKDTVLIDWSANPSAAGSPIRDIAGQKKGAGLTTLSATGASSSGRPMSGG